MAKLKKVNARQNESKRLVLEDFSGILIRLLFLIRFIRADNGLNLNRSLVNLHYLWSFAILGRQNIKQQLNSARIFAGTVPVSGPGVSVTITADYDLYSMDVIDIVNELKVSGAEVIAINNQRVTTKTRLTQETDSDEHLFLAMNGERLLTPIVITAIGDPATLEKGLTFTGGIIDNLNTLYGIYPIVRQEQEVIVPAADLNTNPAYMRLPEQTTPAAPDISAADWLNFGRIF